MTLDEAVAALDAGELIVVPTDTVYGIAARPGDVRKIFDAKGRPDRKPVPVLCADLEQARSVARFDERAASGVRDFWPGPLTLVLERAEGFDAYLGDGATSTVAVRVPDHDVTLRLLQLTGPLAVTSANLSGRAAATTVAEAREALGGRVDGYIDGGPARGRASTVVSLVGTPRLLREGEVAADAVLQKLTE